jgi:hypothetical protein
MVVPRIATSTQSSFAGQPVPYVGIKPLKASFQLLALPSPKNACRFAYLNLRQANDPIGDTGQMKKYMHSLTLILALGAGCAVAQTMPRQQPQQNPGMPQTQQPPSDQAQRTAGSTSDVQSDIQSAFQKEPTLANANINVQVSGNNVELSGTVPDQATKDQAEQIARTHSGGLSVKNHIKVAAGK